MIVAIYVAMAIFVITLVLAVILASMRYRSKRLLTPVNTLVVGMFITSYITFFPVFWMKFAGNAMWSRVISSIFLTAYNSLSLFAIRSNYSETIINFIPNFESGYAMLYSVFATELFVIMPMLTFGFILSFFRNLNSYKRYLMKYLSRNTYVFSELNDKSIILAESIYRSKGKKAVLVFTDVFEPIDEDSSERMERAKRIGAICFKKDVLSINLHFHSKKGTITFFEIDIDETKNLHQSIGILEAYKERDLTELYVFSTSIDCELMLSATEKGKVKVRRIDDIRSLMYRTLYEMEMRVLKRKNTPELCTKDDMKQDIFESAKQMPDGEKQISIVILGAGVYGSELVRTFAWFCQMDGYRVSIDVFDKDPLTESKFRASCPELLSDEYNGVYIEGESQYYIKFHTGLDVRSYEFASEIKKLECPTYSYVTLGDDRLNVQAAVDLRVLFEQMGVHPEIFAVVYNSEKKNALDEIRNFKGQPYDISFIGDYSTLYTQEVIVNSELEAEALKIHCKYGSPDDFWMYEYNYRSSMASAAHKLAKRACSISGADKKEEDLTDSQRDILEALEHKRWNAYMRSEGYVYSGSKDKSTRNDLGKMHHNLVDFDSLSEEDKRKDSRVASD